MRIGEMARVVGTDPPTIRYYEAIGILPQPERGQNRYREYGEGDLRRIELVLALRRLDVPVGEIRALSLSCLDHRCATATGELLTMIDRRATQVHQQIEELRGLADRFADLRRRLTTEGRTAMTVDLEMQSTAEREAKKHLDCDCGCSGSGCTCGCACCGVAEHLDHREHSRILEVLARTPEDSCDCGCCG